MQGSDLVVREGWVYLRSPGARLERVDVILRRVDAALSDPLELRGDSQLGIAGLVEAVRRGRVRVVNGLGAGVLENPGLLPYLPAVCEALLGEPLRLASVPTWWCGDPDALDHVLDHLDTLVVRTIDGPSAGLAALAPPTRCGRDCSPPRTATSARSGCRSRRRRPGRGAPAAGAAAPGRSTSCSRSR